MNAPQDRTNIAEAATRAIDGASELDRLLHLQKSFTPMDLLEDNNFDKMWRMAEALANSALSIPKELKGNIGDCLAIVTQAMIWSLNPFAVAQKAHVINGKLGYEAQLVNAVVMQSGAIVGSFHYEHQGDSCRVGAVLRGGSEVTWGEWLSAATVTTKNSPLWKTNPKQQMGYLQVKNWARAYCPGALLGIYSTDELEQVGAGFTADADGVITGPRTPAPPTLPPYAQADFDKNLPAWTKAVASGKKTAPDLLAMLSTKALFTEEQKARVLSLKKAPAVEPPASTTAPPTAVDDDFVRDMDAAEGVQP